MASGLHNFIPSNLVLGTDNPYTGLLELTDDPYFASSDKNAQSSGKRLGFLLSSKSRSEDLSTTLAEKLSKLNLDITRISNRILVMGRCWNYRTDRAACRNNVEEMACFLNARYDRQYLIFNIGSPDTKYDITPFRNQVVSFPVSKILTPTIKALFNVVRSMSAWLQLNPENVAIVQCKNGKSRSGLVIACFLRYCGLFDTVYESFEYFISKRSKDDVSWVTVTLKRYLRYFNDILILEGRIPNSLPLQLHQVILSTVPDFDGRGSCNPGIEVYQDGKLIYSSAIRTLEDYDSKEGGRTPSLEASQSPLTADFETDEDLLREFRISLVLNPTKFDKDYNALVMMDEYNVIFKLDQVILEKDVQIRMYHHNAQSCQNITVFNLAFNTGFMAPGLVRLRRVDLEIPLESSPINNDRRPRFDREFAVDLVVTALESPASQVSYESSTSRSPAKDLLKLSQCHPVRADPLLAKPLELQGHRKFFVKLALQLGNNDIHAAHEFLSWLSKSPNYEKLDWEFLTLGRQQYENLSLHSPARVPSTESIPDQPSHLTKSESIEEKCEEPIVARFIAIEELQPGVQSIEKQIEDQKVKLVEEKKELENGGAASDQLSERGVVEPSSGFAEQLKRAKFKMKTAESPPKPQSPSFLQSIQERGRRNGIEKHPQTLSEPVALSTEKGSKSPTLPFLHSIKQRCTEDENGKDDNEKGEENTKFQLTAPRPPALPFLQSISKLKEPITDELQEENRNEMYASSSPPPPPFPSFLLNSSQGSLASMASAPPPPPPFPTFLLNNRDSASSLPLSSPPPVPPFFPKFLQSSSSSGTSSPPPLSLPLPNFIKTLPNSAVGTSAGPPPPPPLPSFIKSAPFGSVIDPTRLPPMLPFLKQNPPTPSTQSMQISSLRDNRHKIKNTLHWGEIRDESKIKNTVWSELMDSELLQERSLDVHVFEELFCVGPDDERRVRRISSREGEAAKKEYSSFLYSCCLLMYNCGRIRLLDSRRGNNVGIGLSRFYKRLDNEEILEAIITKKELLSIDDLLCLKSILPTEGERQLLLLFKGNSEQLNAAEKFMLAMCKEPNALMMVDALVLEHQFQGEIDGIKHRLASMISILARIKESPGLKTILKLVLELGNLANYDYGRVPAHMRIRGKALGFTMDSLVKLHEVKSVDRKSSLLDYLAMVIKEMHRETITIPDEFAELAIVRHWDSVAIFGEVDELKTSLNRATNLKGREEANSRVEEFREGQRSFIALAKSKLEKIIAMVESAKEAWSITATYLGEDPDDKRPEELFIVLDQFFRNLRESLQKIAKKEEIRRKEMAKKTTAKSADRSDQPSTSAEMIPSRSNTPNSLAGSSSPVPSEIETEPEDTTIIDKEMSSKEFLD